MKYLLLFLIPATCFCTEYKPWYRRDLEPHPKASYTLQHYDELHSSSGSIEHSTLNHFVNLSLEGSYTTYDLELEINLAGTRDRYFGFDDLRLTGRYRLWDDIVGDFLSVTTGVTFIKAFKKALHDVSTFHHAQFEVEGHLAFGKECSYQQFWLSRWWGVFAIGVGDFGSPWLRGNFAWEKNFCNCHHLCLFVDTLWGFGNDALDIEDFTGYGAIRHRSVNVGLSYEYETDCYGIWSIGYVNRVWAYNFPRHVNSAFVSLLYPIGL